MKLTIEHLKGYLGTGLEWHNSIIGKTLKMQGCEFTNELRIRLTDGLYAYDACKIKLLLYPLSSLTEYREDLGFVPIIELKSQCSYAVSNEIDKFLIYKNYGDMPNWVINKFQNWHIDYLNLIENNLAIDKRTIKN